jgi:hypothetical protein
MVFFWTSAEEAREVLRALEAWGAVACWFVIMVTAAPILAALEGGKKLFREQISGERRAIASDFFRVAVGAALIWACAVIHSLIGHAAPDIVYKAF